MDLYFEFIFIVYQTSVHFVTSYSTHYSSILDITGLFYLYVQNFFERFAFLCKFDVFQTLLVITFVQSAFNILYQLTVSSVLCIYK